MATTTQSISTWYISQHSQQEPSRVLIQ